MEYLKMRIILLFSLTAAVLGSGTDLEQDCSNSTHDYVGTTRLPTTTPSFPFRTDLLTKEECFIYSTLGERSACRLGIVLDDACNVTEQDPYYKYYASSRTYLELECRLANRSDMRQLTRSIPRISPNRAVTILLTETSDASHPIDSDVIHPIRQQIVELTVVSNTSATTFKVYEAGTLPRLLRFKVQHGKTLKVKKRDFSRMPEVRMICFESSMFDSLERYTFMDLPKLESLVLEERIRYMLYKTELYEKYDPTGTVNRPMSIEDIQKVRRLHCDCSFVWLRNFLKQTPHLASRKAEGEVFVVGNYYSPAVLNPVNDLNPEVLSVDCGRKLSYNNTNAGWHFSYNTSCYTYNLSCS